MNKAELVKEISEKIDLSKRDIDKTISAMLEVISEVLAEGEKVVLKGFGSFEVRVRQAYTARNPRNGVVVEVDESSVPVFKPSITLKRMMK